MRRPLAPDVAELDVDRNAASHLPLASKEAGRVDVDRAFGGAHVMQHNTGLDVRIANAGGDRSHPATRAMFNTLDKTSAGIADILVGADKSETLLQGWHNDSAGQGNVLGNVLTLLAALPRGTEGHDVLSAVLAQSQVANDCVQNPIGKRVLFGAVVASNSMPDKQKESRMKVSDEIVEVAVQFILSPDRINLLSWGVEQIKDTEKGTIEIPALARKLSKSTFWLEYKKAYLEPSTRLGQTAFDELVNTLTSKQDTSRNAIDCKSRLFKA